MKNILKILLLINICFLALLNCASSQVYVSWDEKSLNGVTLSGNTLTKTTDTGWGKAGASTENFLPANENGYMQFKITSLSNQNAYGLSDINTNDDYTSIDFVILIKYDLVYVYLNGELKGEFGIAHLNDIFKIERNDTIMRFKKNGIIFYSTITKPDRSLLVDVSLHDQYTSLNEVKCNFSGKDFNISAIILNETDNSSGSIFIDPTIASEYETIWDGNDYPSQIEFDEIVNNSEIFDSVTVDTSLYDELELQAHIPYSTHLTAGVHTLALNRISDNYAYHALIGMNLEWFNDTGMYYIIEPFPNILDEEKTSLFGDGITLRKTTPSGYSNGGYSTSINCFRSNANWQFQFVIPDLIQKSKVGLKEYNSDPPYEGLIYGFEFLDGKYSIFVSGSQYSWENFRSGDLLSLQHFFNSEDSSEHFIYSNNNVVYFDTTISFNRIEEYFLNVSIDDQGAAIEKIFAVCDKPAPLFNFQFNAIDIINTTGSIIAEQVYSNSFYGDYSYEWYDSGNNLISSSSEVTNVEPGTYTLRINYTIPNEDPGTVEKVLSLNSKIFWTDAINATTLDEVNSTFGGSYNTPWNSGVASVNLLRESEVGYVEY
ncbi:MAG: hypothetical protein ACHQNT_06885, partial [Bacteroidia bacterium]